MSTSLIGVFDQLRARVRDYLATAYWTNDPAFNAAREALLLDVEQGPVFREPLFEPAHRYVASTLDAQELLRLAGLENLNPADKERAVHFLQCFAPIGARELYAHQENAIRAAIQDGKPLVVTTGTGSGKSFCFQIPVILSLLSEALGAKGRQRWRGPALSESTWWETSPKSFQAQRQTTTRSAAVRALLMYPLNALVQDQVDGLRGLLDSPKAQALYASILGGDRIFFGQYSGSTLGSGNPSASNASECAKALKAIAAPTPSEEEELDPSIQRLHGSELLTRWDMQRFPPDILITNYSMLSIMLLREHEEPILKSTREWLRESPENRFFLVIDELHSYRGTAGTEISYIVRAFLERIGLKPDNPQLQIIATSASLSPEDGQKFLGDFFGVDTNANPFVIIDGPSQEPLPQSVDSVREFGRHFAALYEGEQTDERVAALAAMIGQGLGMKQASAVEIFDRMGAHDALLVAAKQAKEAHPERSELNNCPLSLPAIARGLFDGDLNAARGYMACITGDWACLQGLRAKTRMHLFIRNVDGVRRALDTSSGTLASPILYDASIQMCPETRALTLDVHYCQECGELYYFGYKNKQGSQIFVSNDPPTDKSTSSDAILIHFSRSVTTHPFQRRAHPRKPFG